jgi:Holliday junction resolvase
MSRYVKGRRLEYRVRDFLRSKGYVVIRAAQSKPVDPVALRNGKTLLIECKTEKSSLTRQRRTELIRLIEVTGASLIIARKKQRIIEFTDLNTGSSFSI